MTALTNDLARLLSDILEDSTRSALEFRAKHEASRGILDDLERQGLLFRHEDRYILSLLLVADLAERHYVTAQRICHFCGGLLDVFYRLYKQEPGRKFTLEELATATESPPTKVQRTLAYLMQAPVWKSAEGPSSAPEAITPHEGILDLRDFPSVLKFLRAQQEQRGKPPAPARERHQKFPILESSGQLDADLESDCGVLGRSVIFFDLDDFKALNTRLTETRVDRSILPFVHQLIADCAQGHARAYCVGGDEFVFLLSNASKGIALAFAEEVRARLFELRFEGDVSDVRLTASMGVAYGTSSEDGRALRERANVAMRRAKDSGRNCVVLWSP
jgi:diguanylate cyclase (GGDEF)-like protein